MPRESRGGIARHTCKFVLVLVLLQAALLAHGEERYIEDNDRFPGWKGELPGVGGGVSGGQPKALSQDRTGVTVGYGEDGVVRASILTSKQV